MRKLIRVNGEDIVCGPRQIKTARQKAKRISTSPNHSWAAITYKRNGTYVRETWYEGRISGYRQPAPDWWFDATQTIMDVMRIVEESARLRKS